jgi:hypothetical protein
MYINRIFRRGRRRRRGEESSPCGARTWGCLLSHIVDYVKAELIGLIDEVVLSEEETMFMCAASWIFRGASPGKSSLSVATLDLR